jgi:hypothetical protein
VERAPILNHKGLKLLASSIGLVGASLRKETLFRDANQAAFEPFAWFARLEVVS